MAADTGMDTCPSPEITDSRKRPLDGDSENGDVKRSHFSSGEYWLPHSLLCFYPIAYLASEVNIDIASRPPIAACAPTRFLSNVTLLSVDLFMTTICDWGFIMYKLSLKRSVRVSKRSIYDMPRLNSVICVIEDLTEVSCCRRRRRAPVVLYVLALCYIVWMNAMLKVSRCFLVQDLVTALPLANGHGIASHFGESS